MAGDGTRVKSVLNGVTTYYVGNTFEWTGDTTSMVKYYYADSQRVAMRQGSSTLYFLLGDHLGSTSITANSSGGKVAELRYHPWGGTRYTDGTTPTTRRFTGQIEDAAIGLYFYNARSYDPSLGRFIQADTMVPSPANPQSLNRYSYVLNSPLRYTDPSGHWGMDVHYGLTREWVNQVTSAAGQPNSLAGQIAKANLAVDIEAIQHYLRDESAGKRRDRGEHQDQQPNPALDGAVTEQYYHYPSKADAEARLLTAIEARDPEAFGRALHSYQDYYAHTLNGFTALPDDMASIAANCPACLSSSDVGATMKALTARTALTGHDGVKWPDQYVASSARATAMRNGSLWYIIKFVIAYYGLDYKQFKLDNPDLIDYEFFENENATP